jgi:outer membrane protein OmpA-like peptidoglycan-associated protein
MRVISNRPGALILLAMLTVTASGSLAAQEQAPASSTIIVEGMIKGPEIKGIITARTGDKMKVTAADGTSTIIGLDPMTKVKGGSGGLFGGSKAKLTTAQLLNGLPVTVKTIQADGALVASEITFRKGDFKTATMIRQGTEQGFAEQTAATEALRGRMADIDKYNIKGTTNVYFDTGKYALSPQARTELCTTATEADGMNGALMLVVGYTDSVGSEEYNQTLSEKRASSVINYLQQGCKWKPWRVLTPTGMAESDPLASNDTEEGKAQNRRVSVNVLVSKSIDGI